MVAYGFMGGDPHRVGTGHRTLWCPVQPRQVSSRPKRTVAVAEQDGDGWLRAIDHDVGELIPVKVGDGDGGPLGQGRNVEAVFKSAAADPEQNPDPRLSRPGVGLGDNDHVGKLVEVQIVDRQ